MILTSEIVKFFCFQVATNKIYDLTSATNHIQTLMYEGIQARQLPSVMLERLQDEKRGCCLHFAAALYGKLQRQSIKCWLAVTFTSEQHPHVSVCYQDKRLAKKIADPSALAINTPRPFNGTPPPWNIPLSTHIDAEGSVHLFDLEGENGNLPFFGEFLQKAHQVYR